MSLKWEGDKVIKKMDKCIIQGMNQTMAKAVEHAKKNHAPGWENITGVLEGSIRAVKAAHKVADGFISLWGSVDVSYALVLELGGVHMTPRPYLRPAADAEYPQLTDRIARCFK